MCIQGQSVYSEYITVTESDTHVFIVYKFNFIVYRLWTSVQKKNLSSSWFCVDLFSDLIVLCWEKNTYFLCRTQESGSPQSFQRSSEFHSDLPLSDITGIYIYRLIYLINFYLIFTVWQALHRLDLCQLLT